MCHLSRHTLVADSLRRNPVTDRTTCIVVPPYVDKKNYGGVHGGLLPVLNIWNHSRFSVDLSEMLTVYLLPEL
jgi:hypothetical protein